MKPILYSDQETTFVSNGIGVLYDAISCEVTEELNGQYELAMKYPLTGIHAESIADRCIIVDKPNPTAEPQPFRIYNIRPSSAGTIVVNARHLAYDAAGIPIAPFSASSAAEALVNMKAAAAVECPFSFYTDKDTAAALSAKAPKSLWRTLGGSTGSILDVYGGEYEFNRYDIHLHNRRGADRGVSIRYGKNLRTLEQDRSCAECYTGVYPYWTDANGENLVQLPEKTIAAQGTYNYVKILTLDLSAEWQEPPTEDELRARAEKYMVDNDIGVPAVSWKVEFVALEQTEEYKGQALLERVLLGDTVTVVFPLMGVNASARAVKTVYNCLLDRYESVTLGRVKSNLADTIAKQQQELDKKPSMTLMQNIVSSLGDAITGAKGGAVRFLDTDGDGMPDTLYIADNPDPNLAKYVWRQNYLGWAASEDGYNGPFVLGATIKDGLLAEFVKAAHLIAGTIQSKDGKVFLDLDNGIFNAEFTKLSISIDAEVFLPPTHADVMTMLWSLSFPDRFPVQDFYDLNDDGVFDREDILLAQDVYLGKVNIADCPGAYKTPVTVTLNPSNTDATILISGSNMWGSEIVTSLGADGSRIPMIRGDCTVTGKMAVGGDAIIQTLATTVQETAKVISWKDNGDGTYTLIGTDQSE